MPMGLTSTGHRRHTKNHHQTRSIYTIHAGIAPRYFYFILQFIVYFLSKQPSVRNMPTPSQVFGRSTYL